MDPDSDTGGPITYGSNRSGFGSGSVRLSPTLKITGSNQSGTLLPSEIISLLVLKGQLHKPGLQVTTGRPHRPPGPIRARGRYQQDAAQSARAERPLQQRAGPPLGRTAAERTRGW
jgi:hypothetical protein